MLTNGSAIKPGWQFKLPKNKLNAIKRTDGCNAVHNKMLVSNQILRIYINVYYIYHHVI